MKHSPITTHPVRNFFFRGLLFGGSGPIIAGIIYLILHFALEDLTLTGLQVFTAIVSTYLLAFVHAGASVFNQIESWSIAKSLFCHFSMLYVAYVLCYVINSWIPFEPIVLGIFTAIFVVGYAVIWFAVYLSIKSAAKRLNKKLH